MSKILSIAIPSYNVEIYLDRCLKTLIHEYLLDRLQVIIVNDGSKDNTATIAKRYTKMYPNTFLLINKENGGHGSAINAGIKNAIGKYFRVIDADDWVDTQSLVTLVTFLENTDIDLISTNYHRVNMETGHSFPIIEKNVEYNRIYSFKDIYEKKSYFSIHSTTYKTSILKDNNIKLQHNTFYVDVEYQFFPIPYINTIIYLDLFVYKYMVGNVNQSVDSLNMVRRYDHHDRVVKSILKFLDTTNLPLEKYLYIEDIFVQILNTHYYISLFYNHNVDLGRELTRNFDKFLYDSNKILYRQLMKQFPLLKDARKYNFDISKMFSSSVFKLKRKVGKLLKRFIKKRFIFKALI